MNWFERLMEQGVERMCPLCPHAHEANAHADLAGDKVVVPDLSPTCPQNPTNSSTRITCSGFQPVNASNGERRDGLAGDAMLELLCSRSAPMEARYLREERAAILEFEAGFPRHVADARTAATPMEALYGQ